jgi:3-methyladenine DNA glycosylase/8-oxoguanine DNA glycosylase
MRKRAAIDDEAPAPKRHHPDAVEQLVETIKFQQQQIEKATNIWVRLKGGEDRLGDANTMFLGLIKSAMYSGSLAVKLVEKQDEDIDEYDE